MWRLVAAEVHDRDWGVFYLKNAISPLEYMHCACNVLIYYVLSINYIIKIFIYVYVYKYIYIIQKILIKIIIIMREMEYF